MAVIPRRVSANMKGTIVKLPILSTEHAAFLADAFTRNRHLYSGYRMEDESVKSDATEGEKAAAAEKPETDKAADKARGDEPLGDAGKKALEAERDARKAAQEQVKSLKGEFDGFKTALVTALGIKPKEGDKTEDALSAVQQQLADMKRESSVLRLANEYKITDAKDLELLATAKDADSMKTLAERLAPKEDEAGDAKSRTRRPSPDRAQGGAATKGDATVAKGRDLYAERHGKKTNA